MTRSFRSTALFCLFIAISLLTACEELREFYDTVKNGAPCESNATCFFGTCLTEAMGFPNGMCTRQPCAEKGCVPFTEQCFQAQLSNDNTSICLRRCDQGKTCDRKSEGYECRIVDDTTVCVPPNAIKSQVPGVTGSSCNLPSDCHGDHAVCLTDFKGGYCSQEQCNTSEDCLNQEPCVPSNPEDAQSKKVCLKGCQTNDDCRFAYACNDYNGSRVCLPTKDEITKNPDGRDDGEPCESNLQCKGGTCIPESGTEENERPAYKGGYCTTRDCAQNVNCHGNAICTQRARQTACFASCTQDSDCREGYTCASTPEGQICDTAVEPPPQKLDNDGSLEIQCQSQGTLSFSVPSNAIGFYLNVFSRSGDRVLPQVLTLPDQSTLNIASQYAFHNVNPSLLGALAPMLFPASDEATFRNAFTAGDYTLTVRSSADEICYYVIPKLAQGRNLNVRLHLVGVEGISASNASSNQDLQAVVRAMQQIYSNMNISVSVSDYVEASSTVTSQYRILRNFNDIFSLVATSTSPSPTLSDALVINVFLIQDFAISEAPGLLGVSTGIPGVAALHGNIGSGLVFSTASLGSDNQQLGQTMAHEIGHFIALRHTTEHEGVSHDPITDTPECKNPKLQYACPDAKNFMFAYAMGTDQIRTSDGQAFVLKHSPLVK